MAIRGTRSTGAVVDSFNMSFNDITGYVPGKGRGDAKVGKYIHRNGKILVVFTKNPALVDIPARANGKKTNKTGKTRIGMGLLDSAGDFRLVTCGDGADGVKNWKPYTGSITL